MNLTVSEMTDIYVGDPPLQKLPERLTHIQELGSMLSDNYNDNFLNLLEATEGHIFGPKGLVTRLTQETDSYKDNYSIATSTDVKEIQYNKRVQLVAGMLEGRFGKDPTWKSKFGRQIFNKGEIDQLSVYADYILPVAQKLRGRLQFSESLDEAMTIGEVMDEDDPRVIAFRAATIRSCQQDVENINTIRRDSGLPPINNAEYDANLWTSYHNEVGPSHPLVDTLRF